MNRGAQEAEQSGSLESTDREAVVGLVVRHHPESSQLEFLLTLRSPDLREHAAQVSMPGGMLEADERQDHLRALDREVFEETGIPLGSIEWSPSHWDVLPSRYGIDVYPYLGFLRADHCPITLALDPREVAEAQWLPLSALFDEAQWTPRDDTGRIPFDWRGWKHVTWGLTAAILALFVRRVRGLAPNLDPFR